MENGAEFVVRHAPRTKSRILNMRQFPKNRNASAGDYVEIGFKSLRPLVKGISEKILDSTTKEQRRAVNAGWTPTNTVSSFRTVNFA